MDGHHLAEEAEAFDSRTAERLANGFVPDLQRAAFVPYLYNNPWRHPELARAVFGRYIEFAAEHLPPPPARILEVACGPGHVTLELARFGYDVVGVDLSRVSIDAARAVAAGAPRPDGFGSLDYVAADFMTWEPHDEFDGVVFCQSFHHFDDPAAVVDRVLSLSSPAARIVVIEPARDWFSPLDGAVAALIRLLLSAHGAWYESIEVPATVAEVGSYVDECIREYVEATDRDEGEQSPHDNASTATEMLDALRAEYDDIACTGAFAFVPRLVGGVRDPSAAAPAATVPAAAELLVKFDDYLVAEGLLQPGVMLYAGRRR